MKRTTVFADEEMLAALRAIARERDMSLAEAIRQALAAFVAKHRPRRKPLSIIGAGGKTWHNAPSNCSASASDGKPRTHRGMDILYAVAYAVAERLGIRQNSHDGPMAFLAVPATALSCFRVAPRMHHGFLTVPHAWTRAGPR